MKYQPSTFLPPEWHNQSGIMLTWPHINSDWVNLINEVEECFIQISNEILENEKLLVVTCDPERILHKIEKKNIHNLIIYHLDSNDTWARDHGAISVYIDNKPNLLDFQFNGWGMKFPANLDNQLNNCLYKMKAFLPEVGYRNHLNFVLEGGSIEVDGKGTLLTTEACLLSKNRNQAFSKNEIEEFLLKTLGQQRILWLSAGFLKGDDTDSHIDTLARFCNENTIAYIKCYDPSDLHYEELSLMEEELKTFSTIEGKPYNLVPLPMAVAVFDSDGHRLPATYANFLIMNKKVLLPFYGTHLDIIARDIISSIFPTREVVGIDCSVLIQQHGSLHCVTMQFPEGIV